MDLRSPKQHDYLKTELEKGLKNNQHFQFPGSGVTDLQRET